LSREERETKIKQWVKTQIAKLVGLGHIKTEKLTFEEIDFKWIQHVIENSKAALLHDEKVQKQ